MQLCTGRVHATCKAKQSMNYSWRHTVKLQYASRTDLAFVKQECCIAGFERSILSPTYIGLLLVSLCAFWISMDLVFLNCTVVSNIKLPFWLHKPLLHLLLSYLRVYFRSIWISSFLTAQLSRKYIVTLSDSEMWSPDWHVAVSTNTFADACACTVLDMPELMEMT